MANRYQQIVSRVFHDRWRDGMTEVSFTRDELIEAAALLGVARPSNVGDILYSFRYRNPLPDDVTRVLPPGREWIIETISVALYRFRMVPELRIVPAEGRFQIKVPDATPQIVEAFKLSDEQALLAKIRYNRLIDIFTGITTYSLQNHLRTALATVQIEVDELYVGVSKTGEQFVLPVQAKGGQDKIGRIQIQQDAAFCAARFPELACRPIAAQFMTNGVIALFELVVVDDEIAIKEERHYRLVPASEISSADRFAMRDPG